jgi:hypothetical protein
MSATSTQVLSAKLFGINLILSIIKRHIGGMKMGIAKTYLEIAVYVTALLAHAFDFPWELPFSSTASIPFYNSVFLINHALREPAVEQAKKLLTEFIMINFEPFKFLVYPDKAFLIPKATVIDEATAAL